MKKVLYESRPFGSDSETEIYQEGDKVIFNHSSPLDEEGHRTSFGAKISIDVYKKRIDDLLKTGKCIMEEPSKIEGLLGERLILEKTGANLSISCSSGTLLLLDFDFNKLVLLARCPKCNQDKGKLVHTGTEARDEEIGVYHQDLIGYYECQNCGHKWDLVLKIGPPL